MIKVNLEDLEILPGKALIKPIPKRAVSIIILDPTEGEVSDTEAEILKVAEDVTIVTAGDIIRLPKLAGQKIRLNKIEHRFVRQTDIGIVYDDDYPVGIRAIFDRVIIDADEVLAKTDAGIIIPEAARKGRKTGKVINFGGYDFNGNPITLPEGTTVLFPEGAGTDFKGSDNKTYYIMRFGDLILKFL